MCTHGVYVDYSKSVEAIATQTHSLPQEPALFC